MSPARLDHSRSRARASYLAALPSTRSLPGSRVPVPVVARRARHSRSIG